MTAPPETESIHIYLRHVSADAPAPAPLDWLDDAERARAARFVREIDGRHFIEARLLLRRALSDRLSIEPAALRFHTSPHGKPAIDPPDAAGTTFNVSHTDGLVALAVASGGRRIGVDVERRGRATGIAGIAKSFRPSEAAYLAGLPADRREAAFLRLWTRKEATHKADGRGLSLPLDSFDVIDDRCPPWTLRDVALPPGYVGALAYEGDDPPPIRIHAV